MNGALAVRGVGLRSDTLIGLRRLALAWQSKPALAALPGGYATRRKGQGLEVADVRECVAGDDIRHLDRGATARTGRLHVREFQEERDRVSLLVADFRPSMLWGLRRAFRSVAAAEALALLGWQIVESGGRVGLLALTAGQPVVVRARGRARGMLDVIGGMVEAHEQALATAAQDDPPLDAALTRVMRLVSSGAEIWIASGFDAAGPGLGDQIDALSRRRHPHLLFVTDDLALPPGRYPVNLPDGRFVRLRVSGRADAQANHTQDIAGRSALVLQASEPVEQTARRLSGLAGRGA